MPTGRPISTLSNKEYLLDVAEGLFVARGVDDVSLRAIGREAGQRNQSALQYHFGNRKGLIIAIATRRRQQLEARRAALLANIVPDGEHFSLRQVIELQIRAPFSLCSEDTSFRHFLGLFGLKLLSSDSDIGFHNIGASDSSSHRLREDARQCLAHLPLRLVALRAENALSTSLLALSRRAKYGGKFKGPSAELFFSNLVDQVVAMILAPISEETEQQL